MFANFLSHFKSILCVLSFWGAVLHAEQKVSFPLEETQTLQALIKDKDMSLQKLQRQLLSFLKQQAGKDSPKTPFVYTSEPYSHPIEDYINGADSHSAEYCHRILQILQFAHTYLRMPETEAKSLGIYTLCCLTKAVR